VAWILLCCARLSGALLAARTFKPTPVDTTADAICVVRGVGADGVGDIAVTLDPNTNERSLFFGSSGSVIQTTVGCGGKLTDEELYSCRSFGNWARAKSAAECPPCPCHRVVGPFPKPFACLTEMARSVTSACAIARTATTKTYDVLIIGMGGGGLATHIGRDCGRNTYVDAIEYDQRVIDVSQRYFGVQKSGSMAVERSDCLDAVKERVAKGRVYDAILVDCFSRGGITPQRCRNAEFVSSLSKLLGESGFVGHHLWHEDGDHPQVASEFTETTALYQRIFGNTTIVPLSTHVNDIVYARKR